MTKMTAPSRGTRFSPAISMRRKKTRSAKRRIPTMMRLTILRKYSRSVAVSARVFVSVRGDTHGARGRGGYLFRQKLLYEAAQLGQRVVGNDVKDARGCGLGQLAR